MYDVTIIGLGSAGATFARLLNKNYKVLAIDKKHLGENSFMKPCGGLLSPSAQKRLAQMNLTLPKKVLVDPQIFSVLTFDTNNNLIANYQRSYVNMDRHKFDMWLIELINDNVDLRLNSNLKEIIRNFDSTYTIRFDDNGTLCEAVTRMIVGADGANSYVRKCIYPNHSIRSYLSVQQWFEDVNDSPLYACIFDPKITDSYCWAISKDGKFILGGAFKQNSSKESLELLKYKLQMRGFKFGEPIKTEACMVLRPKWIHEDIVTGYSNVFLLGEAGGMISSSSLEGISFAFESAKALALVINENGFNQHNNLNEIYDKKCRKIKLRLVSKQLKSPFMYNKTLRKYVMKSKITSL